jgi:small subunit ribosomal protein S1
VKIIDVDLERRRISLSIKQAAEGGEVAAEYREFYGEHAYDEQGNYIGPDYSDGEGPPPPAEGVPASESPAPDAAAGVATAEAAPAGEETPDRAPDESAQPGEE